MRIGFIGLGVMGAPMACDPVRTGHTLNAMLHPLRVPGGVAVIEMRLIGTVAKGGA